MSESLLAVHGDVARPLSLTYDDLAALSADAQVADISRLDAKRKGDAVKLDAVLKLAGVKPSARYLTLHSSTDDFHASIPLEVVRERGLLVYRLEGEPLPVKAGGPFRFFIPDFAACHTQEVDECANVKFVDLIELSQERGQDNRPSEEEEHAKLHERQQGERPA